MGETIFPSLNDVIFNHTVLEDFLLDNKLDKPKIISFLQSLNHDLYHSRSKTTQVHQMVVDLVVSLVCFFHFSIVELNNASILSFDLLADVCRTLSERYPNEPKYSVELLRLFLCEFTRIHKDSTCSLIDEEKQKIFDELLDEFWENPHVYLDSPAFDELQNWFIDGLKDRNEIYRLFCLKKSQRLLDALQDEFFGTDWLFSQNVSVDKMSSTERDFISQMIKSGRIAGHIDDALRMILKRPVDFFSMKCFFDLFFTKIIIADYSVIGVEEEKYFSSDSNLLKEQIDLYVNLDSASLSNLTLLPFYPNIYPKNHLFLFFLVVSRLGVKSYLSSFDRILSNIHQKLPFINKQTSSVEISSKNAKKIERKIQKTLLSGLEYEIFNYKSLATLHKSCLDDKLWNFIRGLNYHCRSSESPETLMDKIHHEDRCHTSVILLHFGISLLRDSKILPSFHFISAALRLSQKQFPFPQLKFVAFCKNALFEVCFILVNEIQQPEHLPLVYQTMRMLSDQIPTNCHRIVFFCANLINNKMIGFAIEAAKNFLQVAGKQQEISRSTASLLKVLYNSSICISLFDEKEGITDFKEWSPKQISLLLNASDSLFRNISSDQDMTNLFICFVSLLNKGEVYLGDFIGLFLGNLNSTQQTEDVICLKYFSRSSLFTVNTVVDANGSNLNGKKSFGCASICDSNEKLSAGYKPILSRKEGASFSIKTLKSVIISLYERPLSVDYFYSKSALGYSEIVFLQEDYWGSLAVVLFYMMNTSKFFSVPLDEIDDLQLMCERIACCLWKLGKFGDLLLLLQLLDKRTKFWFALKLHQMDMIMEDVSLSLFDVDLVEYLAAISASKTLINHLVSIKNANVAQIENKILKYLALKYLI